VRWRLVETKAGGTVEVQKGRVSPSWPPARRSSSRCPAILRLRSTTP